MRDPLAAELADDGSKAAILDRNAKRAILEDILKAWAQYLELVARNAGDALDLRNAITSAASCGVMK